MYQLIDGGSYVVAEAHTYVYADMLREQLGGDLYIRRVKFKARHGNGGIYPLPRLA